MIALGLLVIVAGIIGYYLGSSRVNVEREMNLYQNACLHREGSDRVRGAYHIISIDGGVTWYECDQGKIVGPADPELVGRLVGMELLTNYINQHGPLTFTGQNADFEVKLLHRAGLTIKTK